MSRKITWAIVVSFFLQGGAVQAQLLSDFFNDLQVNLADGVALPTKMFAPSGPNPFSDIEITGSTNPSVPVGTTTAGIWNLTIDLQHLNGFETLGGLVGPFTNVPVTIQMSEINSDFNYYEPTDGVFVDASGADPIKNSSMNLIGQINIDLQDADGNPGNGFTPFVNDMPFDQIPVNPGTPIAVWAGQPIQVEIVALTLTGVQPIAVNGFIPFGIFGDDGTQQVDNSFGIYTGDWVLPLGDGVLIDESGTGAGPFVMSPFLKAWTPRPQVRWKPHRGGLVPVVVGAQAPAPAGVIHPSGGGIPEPSTMVLAILAAFGMIARRRSA